MRDKKQRSLLNKWKDETESLHDYEVTKVCESEVESILLKERTGVMSFLLGCVVIARQDLALRRNTIQWSRLQTFHLSVALAFSARFGSGNWRWRTHIDPLTLLLGVNTNFATGDWILTR
jgi:hypothetical protein